MLDSGLSAPQVSKFSRHLSADALHDAYFIQSVGVLRRVSLAMQWGMSEAIIWLLE